MAAQTSVTTHRRDSLFDGGSMLLDHTIGIASPPPSLHSLPAEILLLIRDASPTASVVALRLVCSSFRALFAPPKRPRVLDRCTGAASSAHVAEHGNRQDHKYRCALCKAVYRENLFQRAAILDPHLQYTNFATTLKQEDERKLLKVALKNDCIPATRICSWHINRFTFPASAALQSDYIFNALMAAASTPYKTATDGGRQPPPVAMTANLNAAAAAHGWASSVEQVCMHCGCIIVCACSVGSCGRCVCEDTDCSSCGVRAVRCWWRLAVGLMAPRCEASFAPARQAWLLARADELRRYGWEGRGMALERLLDWGLVRAVRCGNSQRTETSI